MKKVSSRIVLCFSCKGSGTMVTPRTREAHGETVPCDTCAGKRVLSEITTVTLERVE